MKDFRPYLDHAFTLLFCSFELIIELPKLLKKWYWFISDYFLGECYDVCMRRLEVLLDSNLNIPAYNLTTYLVQNLFSEDYQNKRSKFSYLHHEWLEKDREKAHSILDVHIAIIYRRKEDTSVLPYLVILFANNWLLLNWY